MQDATNRPHWRRTLAMRAVMATGFADPAAIGRFLLPVGVGVLWAGRFGGIIGRRIGDKAPFVAGLVVASALLATARSDSLARLVVAGIGAQVAAAIMESRHFVGSRAPGESAFTIASGICAVLAAVRATLAWSVPIADEMSRS